MIFLAPPLVGATRITVASRVPAVAGCQGRALVDGGWRDHVPIDSMTALQHFGWSRYKNRDLFFGFPNSHGTLGYRERPMRTQ
jgi:hypothetical protein